jgi:hypothetical protein
VNLLQSFTLVADRVLDDASERALLDQCEGLAIESAPGRPALLRFDREAPTLVDAILGAVRDVETVGLAVSRVDDDEDMVTLAVVASRIGRSREAVRLWSVGRTGPGGFPTPVTGLHPSITLYRWSQIAPWLRERMGMPVPDPEPLIAAVNLALQLRALAPRISRMDVIRALIAA